MVRHYAIGAPWPQGLRAPLARDRRVAFYAVGAALALLLDDAEPAWRARHLEGEMVLD